MKKIGDKNHLRLSLGPCTMVVDGFVVARNEIVKLIFS